MSISVTGEGSTEIERRRQLAAARKALKAFRSSRTSNTTHSSSPSASSSKSRSSQTSIPRMPLTTGQNDNHDRHARSSSKAIGKDLVSADVGLEGKSHRRAPSKSSLSVDGHRRQGSEFGGGGGGGGGGHRRQASSSASGHASRPSVIGVFDVPLYHAIPANDESAFRPLAPPLASDPFGRPGSSTMTTFAIQPPTPMAETASAFVFPTFEDAISDQDGAGDDTAVRDRLTSFSFGTKKASSPNLGPQRREAPPSPLSMGATSRAGTWPRSPLHSPSPSSSSFNHLHTPLSRPPSLLFTRPTPTGPSLASGSSGLAPPSTPPSPARGKRHSHTRSSSISLPNLKLGRPTSLGIPSSPSFPSSPTSPAEYSGGEGHDLQSRLTGPDGGRRLKFEPSGRGAEAEQEREASRKRALDKLTGSISPRLPSPTIEASPAEISLPDLDDEDDSSASSSISRAPSGGLALLAPSEAAVAVQKPSSPFPWLDADPDAGASRSSPSLEKWSIGPRAFDKVDGLGFGLDTTVGKRGSLTGLASKAPLAKVEELDESGEEEETREEEQLPQKQEIESPTPPAPLPLPLSVQTGVGGMFSGNPPVAASTPSRLRELHLVSSSMSSASPAHSAESDSFRSFTMSRAAGSGSASTSHSPPRGYGTIGRGRPHPLSGLIDAATNMSSTSSSPVTANIATPKSTFSLTSRQRRAPGSGSRGSSISYKKDKERDDAYDSTSSREWSLSSKIGSPTMPLGEIASPPLSFPSPRGFGGWAKSSKALVRPCPRPKSLVGLGLDGTGTTSNRLLSEVNENDEHEHDPAPMHWSDGPRSAGAFDTLDDLDINHMGGRGAFTFGESISWRDERLEVELERDALREDVDLWKSKHQNLVATLEQERKEGAVLRDRVRKLGDRLSSVSSSHITQPLDHGNPHLTLEMRQQLFNLTSQLDRERKEKDLAMMRVEQLEDALASVGIAAPPMSSPSLLVQPKPKPFKPLLPSQALVYSDPIPSSPFVPLAPTPAEPLSITKTSAHAQGPVQRMKAWGFPRAAPTPKEKKRETFFGLSEPLRRPSADEDSGVDLPPLPAEAYVPSRSKESVSEGMSWRRDPSPQATAASISLSRPAAEEHAVQNNYNRHGIPAVVDSFAQMQHARGLDFRLSCRCCEGDVLEF